MIFKKDLMELKKDITTIGKKVEKILKEFEKDKKGKVPKASKAKVVKAKSSKKASAKKRATKPQRCINFNNFAALLLRCFLQHIEKTQKILAHSMLGTHG